jgi:hypothetical protein
MSNDNVIFANVGNNSLAWLQDHVPAVAIAPVPTAITASAQAQAKVNAAPVKPTATLWAKVIVAIIAFMLLLLLLQGY